MSSDEQKQLKREKLYKNENSKPVAVTIDDACPGWSSRALLITVKGNATDPTSCFPCTKHEDFWVATQIGTWSGFGVCLPDVGDLKPSTDSFTGVGLLALCGYLAIGLIRFARSSMKKK